jgi:phage/plasmid primase-like uncharacterized protein
MVNDLSSIFQGGFIPTAPKAVPMRIDPIEEFSQKIAAAGLTPPNTIHGDGKLHRYSTDGKPSHKNGWYFLHLDGTPWGQAGSWDVNGGDPVCHWCAKSDTAMTQAERDTQRQRTNAAKAQRDAEHLADQDAAATMAQTIWDAAQAVETGHGYLTRKGVNPNGARLIQAVDAHRLYNRLSPELNGPLLVIPMRNAAGQLRSLQFITDGGVKRPLTGGEKQGCYFAVGSPKGQIIICEGFATGASLAQCTGDAVAVAFDSGNLYAAGLALRGKYPALRIIIAADHDHLTDGNPGLTKARAAAQAVGGLVAVPSFPADRPDKATDFNDLHQLAGLDAVKACIDNAMESVAVKASETAATGQFYQWPAPTEIFSQLPVAPEFDAAVLLPKALADFVLDEADRMPCSPDYIAAALVVCLGSVIGAKCGLKPKRRDDWIVVPNLWGGIVGDPSSKKSPALGTVTRFLDRLEAREAEKLVDAQTIFEAEKAAFEAHQSAVKANMKKAAGGAKPDHLRMAASIADMQDLQAPEQPHALRYKSNDSSVEKLGDILSRNPQGIMVFRDELTGLLASWEREGHEGDRAFYLESWNGTGSFNIDRIGRGEQFVKTLCLSIFGGIQPDKIESYLAGIASSLDNDGRVQRFQVMVYPNAVPWAWCDRYPVKGAREAVRDVFDRLAVFDPVQDGAAPADDFVKLPHFQFDDEAQEVFIEWCAQLNLVHIANEQDPLMKQHLGKFEKLFCSLALILHLAEGNIGAVKVDSALRSAAWCEYLAGHAKRVYGMVEGAKVATAKTMLRRIKEGKLKPGFTVRDVLRKHWTGVTTALQAESALMILEDHFYVKSYEVQDVAHRPTVRYEINPALIEVKA